MGRLTNKLMLGQLVVDMGWVSESQFKECLALSVEIGAPIGRVLRAEGYIADKEMHSLIVAQSMIRDGYISIELAKRALSVSSWWSVPFDQVLSAMGVICDDWCFSNRLGELLVSSGWIERQTLTDAIGSSQVVNVPLGQHLVARGYLSKSLLNMVLDLQTLLRNEQISREEALAAMKAIPASLIYLAGSGGRSVENLRLGQLLANAGLVTHTEVMNVLEIAQINGRPLGEMLLIFGLISQRMLEAALKLQKLTFDKLISPREAVFSLYRTFGVGMSNNKQTMDLRNIDNSRINAVVFLQLVKGLDAVTLKRLESPNDSCSLDTKILDQLDCNTARAATRCAFLVKRSVLTLEQAAFVFHHSRLNQADLEKFLSVSGWLPLGVFASVKPSQPVHAEAA